MIDRQRRILQLFDTSGPRLHRLLARLTQREDVVGDLLQELFIRLWNSNGFDGAQDPSAYAYRAAVNLAFEWRRGRKTTCQLSEENFPVGDGPSAQGKMIRAEELEQVLDATSKLTDLARDVVVMRNSEQEFDVWVRGAMAELSDDGKAPESVTYQNVLQLAEKIRNSLSR